MGLAQGHIQDWNWDLVLSVYYTTLCILKFVKYVVSSTKFESLWESGNDSFGIRPVSEFSLFHLSVLQFSQI